MAFGKTKKPVAPPPTPDQLQVQHVRNAVGFLQRAGKGGRLEAETRLATMGTGYAVLALFREQQKTNELLRQLIGAPPPAPVEAPPVDDDVVIDFDPLEDPDDSVETGA